MKLPNTAEILDQPACEHNLSVDKACEKPKGGESCAFDGAYIVLNPITDAAHLIHGPIACCGNSYEGRGSLSSGSRLYRYGFTTDMTEMNIIYGSEAKLMQAVEYIAGRYKPAAIFVYSTCIPSLTGEDVETVCRQARAKIGIPVIPVIAPGFLGHKNMGNRLAGDVLLNHVIGTGESSESGVRSSEFTINLIGEYNIAGELWNVLPLFEKIGIRVLSKITGDSTFQEITYAHHAKLNLLICGRALVNVARGMETRYGIPFREVSFYGIRNIRKAIVEVARFLQDRDIMERADEVVSEEEMIACYALRDYFPYLRGKKAVVYTGGVKSWSMLSALNDLGMEVTACGVKKSSLSDIAKIKDLIGEERILKDVTPKILLDTIYKTKADILIAGGRNQYLAYKEKIPFIDINQERHTPYAGYRGLVNLAKDIAKTIYSPVWGLAKKELIWERP
ncbi:MAG: nitrogenase iron-molybdenum cofactor biosynthesis protein NifE [Deltaproteobacteria bacterium]|nr:nitrogenase iron-molybdenum cofactor biosynthesis protein NifE [Deltaproteobacteria bacterium]